jgi:hypothetical protein
MSNAAEASERGGLWGVISALWRMAAKPNRTEAPAPEVPEAPRAPETPEHGGLAQAVVVLRRELATFLGLVPLTIAALRVFLMGQGDQGTTFTLIRTLDLQALLVGTFFRFAGLFGVVTALYILVRGLWPRMAARRKEWADEGDIMHRGSDARALALVLVLLLASVGCLYPEQLLDWDHRTTPGPVDLATSVAWVLAVHGLVWLSDRAFHGLDQRLQAEARSGPVRRRVHQVVGWAAILSHTARRFYQSSGPEAWILMPAVVFLFWSFLIANDRMWLPAQVITITQSRDLCVSLPRDAPGSCAAGKYDTAITGNGETSFIGYVLDADLAEETILRPGGGVVVVHRDEVRSVLTCQYEPDYDPGDDKPYFARIDAFQATEASRQNPLCSDVLKAKKAGG